MKEKLEKLLDHWIEHNDEHVASYLKWMEKIKGEEFKDIANRDEIAAKIDDASKQIGKVTEILSQAKGLL